MKILNISTDDYANFAHENANALRSVGVYCVDIKKQPHHFGYASQSKIVTNEIMLQQIKEADIVQIFHSVPELLNLCKSLNKKRVVVYHTGTRYRQKPNEFNQVFNPFVERCFTDQTEFIGLGMKNETYLATAIDTEKLIPTKIPKNKLIIAHYPSNAETKGTKRIVEMLIPFAKDFDIRVDATMLPHEENLKRISECDIYVELFAPEQKGKEYGCYGVTAFEAASMGKIVITQNMHPEVYEKFYGGSIFNCTNDEGQFKKLLEFLKNTGDIQSMQALSREIIVKRHSYKATGQRLKELLY